MAFGVLIFSLVRHGVEDDIDWGFTGDEDVSSLLQSSCRFREHYHKEGRRLGILQNNGLVSRVSGKDERGNYNPSQAFF